MMNDELEILVFEQDKGIGHVGCQVVSCLCYSLLPVFEPSPEFFVHRSSFIIHRSIKPSRGNISL